MTSTASRRKAKSQPRSAAPGQSAPADLLTVAKPTAVDSGRSLGHRDARGLPLTGTWSFLFHSPRHPSAPRLFG